MSGGLDINRDFCYNLSVASADLTSFRHSVLPAVMHIKAHRNRETRWW